MVEPLRQGPRQVTIKAYFVSQDKDTSVQTTPSLVSPNLSSAMDVSPTKEVVPISSSLKKENGKNFSAKSQNVVTSSRSAGSQQQGSVNQSAASVQQLQATVQELKRQVDQLRSLKEQAESMVHARH